MSAEKKYRAEFDKWLIYQNYNIEQRTMWKKHLR